MLKSLSSAFIALLGLNGSAIAQTTGAQTCTLPKIADTVDLKQVPGSDLMTVPVGIGAVTKQFLLDISTRSSEISRKAMNELGLSDRIKLTESFTTGSPVGGNSGNTFISGTKASMFTVYDVKSGVGAGSLESRAKVDSFTIGGATAHNIQLAVSKDKDMGISEPYDGVFTGDLLRKYDVELDFAGKKMIFLTPTICTDPNQVVFWGHSEVAAVPVTMAEDGKLSAQVVIQGHTINAEINTSSARTVMSRGIAEQMLGFKADTPNMMRDGDLKDGVGMQVYVHTFSEISLGDGIKVFDVPVLIQDYSMVHEDREPVLGSRAQFADNRIPDLSIGMDVLERLHMYVVLGQGKVYVTSAK